MDTQMCAVLRSTNMSLGLTLLHPSKRQDQSSLGLFNATKTTGWPLSLKGADKKIACKQIGRLGTREHHQVIR